MSALEKEASGLPFLGRAQTVGWWLPVASRGQLEQHKGQGHVCLPAQWCTARELHPLAKEQPPLGAKVVVQATAEKHSQPIAWKFHRRDCDDHETNCTQLIWQIAMI